MNVLVVGGAGYIGSHMVKLLLEAGHEASTLDSLVSGHRDAVVGGALFEVDLGDTEALARVFESRPFDAVMHFASFIQVGESVRKPGLYYRNNFCQHAQPARRDGAGRGDALHLLVDCGDLRRAGVLAAG